MMMKVIMYLIIELLLGWLVTWPQEETINKSLICEMILEKHMLEVF